MCHTIYSHSPYKNETYISNEIETVRCEWENDIIMWLTMMMYDFYGTCGVMRVTGWNIFMIIYLFSMLLFRQPRRSIMCCNKSCQLYFSVFTQYHPYWWVMKTTMMLHYNCTDSMNHMIDHLGTLFTRWNKMK
jgi:hypothetical protein